MKRIFILFLVLCSLFCCAACAPTQDTEEPMVVIDYKACAREIFLYEREFYEYDDSLSDDEIIDIQKDMMLYFNKLQGYFLDDRFPFDLVREEIAKNSEIYLRYNELLAERQAEKERQFVEKWHESAVYIAKTVWGEARGTSREGQEKVIWCILNRVDSPRFPNTIIKVITAPLQFHGYVSTFPCEQKFYDMALEVITKWQAEKNGEEVDRLLPSDYYFFSADKSGLGNNFRKDW